MEFKSETLGIRRSGAVYYTTFPSFEKTGLVRHLYSTRRGGVSNGYFGPMNLGFTRGDDQQAVIENFRRISFVAEIYPGDMVFSDQVHGDRIVYVDQQDRGKGIYLPKEMQGVDGLITDKPQVCLVTFYADCVPLFFLDPVKKVIGDLKGKWDVSAKAGISLNSQLRQWPVQIKLFPVNAPYKMPIKSIDAHK